MLHHPRRGLVLLLATVAVMACRDGSPTDPADAAVAPAPLVIAAEAATAYGATLEDARTRLLPGLSDLAAAEGLDGALAQLTRALVARDAGALLGAIARTEAALDAITAREAEAVSVGAEIDAIHLVLDQGRVFLRAGHGAGPR